MTIAATLTPNAGAASTSTSGTRSPDDLSGFPQMSEQIKSTVRAAAAKYDIPPRLIAAVIQQESCFNPNARSSCGAQGMMQLMPATARSLGVTDPSNPAQNIEGGTKYLSGLLIQYKGDVSKALAAYNAGPGNVNKYGGVPPFKETQDYVLRITANYSGQAAPITVSAPRADVLSKSGIKLEAKSSFGGLLPDWLNSVETLLQVENGESLNDLLDRLHHQIEEQTGEDVPPAVIESYLKTNYPNWQTTPGMVIRVPLHLRGGDAYKAATQQAYDLNPPATRPASALPADPGLARQIALPLKA